MNAIRIALTELWGLFVEDATLTIGTLACVALAAFVIPRLGLAEYWRAPVFFAAVVLVLLENVYRGARRR
jgi:membrane protein implicated in regulation of membrane protease activity